jgi:RimJ/RimL family protein N-acetyltransferase
MGMIIETERLMLRPFTMDDFDIIYRLYSDEEILRYMPNDIMDEEQARKHLERIVSDWDEVPLVSCEMAVILRVLIA